MCRVVDVKFTEEQMEYIILKVYGESEALNKLPISKIFDIFVDKASQYLQKSQREHQLKAAEDEKAQARAKLEAQKLKQKKHEEDEVEGQDQDLSPVQRLHW